MLFVKELEVCTLVLKREDSIAANYLEIYKEKTSLPGIFPVNLRAEAKPQNSEWF